MSSHSLLIGALAIANLVLNSVVQQSPRDVVATGKLRTRHGPVVVHYPPNSEERAVKVQHLLADAHAFLAERLPSPLAYSVALFGPDEWRAINPPSATYAQFLPGVDGTLPIVFLPATPGHALDQLFGRLWPAERAPDATRFADLVGFHELGHVATRQMNVRIKSGWFGEFLATYVAYSYLTSERPDEAQFWQQSCAALVNRIKPKHTALRQMGGGVGVENYVWYQASLQLRVHEVTEAQGWAFIKQVTTLGNIGEDGLLQALDAIAPGFSGWAARYHGSE